MTDILDNKCGLKAEECLKRKSKTRAKSRLCGKPSLKTHTEQKKWFFNETKELMKLWAQIDLERYESKASAYKQIHKDLKTKGFDRTAEQIRCKINRITCNARKAPVLQHTVSTLSRTDSRNSEQNESSIDRSIDPNCDPMSETSVSSFESTSEDEDLMNWSELESDSSEDSLFDCRTVCPTRPQRDLKGRHEYEEEVPESDKLLQSMQDLSHETKECFQQIMSEQQTLKESIEKFNSELSRLADKILNNNIQNDLNLNSRLDSAQEPKAQSLKFVIPNVNKQYILQMNDS